jgi:hypothetical protein
LLNFNEDIGWVTIIFSLLYFEVKILSDCILQKV